MYPFAAYPVERVIFRLTSTLVFFALFTAPVAVPPVFAHGGEIEVAGGGVRGPVKLTDAQITAIALQTAAADVRAINLELNLNGEVQLLPNRQADVTLRISGQVKALNANLGDSVQAGQNLARVESRLSGNPPPSVNVSAPISGVIDARNVTLGQAVEPNTSLFHISDRSQVIVVAKVFEEDLGKVRPGQQARVHVLSYPDQTFNGKLTLIDTQLDPLSRTVNVWIELANEQGLLKPNMFARAAVILTRNDAALAISNKAIIEANGEKFVFVAEGKTFNRVEVTLGARDDEFSEITDGLVPGDEVVTQGNRQVYTAWLTGGGQSPAEESEVSREPAQDKKSTTWSARVTDKLAYIAGRLKTFLNLQKSENEPVASAGQTQQEKPHEHAAGEEHAETAAGDNK